MNIFVVSDEGLSIVEKEGGRWTATRLLAHRHLQCVALDPHDAATIFAGSRKAGVFRSADGGRTWTRLEVPVRAVFSLAVSAASGTVYAGTEPSRLFASDDGGASWRELEGLQAIPSRPTWRFPPRPWTSHVRQIAPHPSNPDLLLVGIELGGLMRSTDGGRTWSDHRPGAQKDVHALAWHPTHAAYAYEAGGGGAAWSRDGGRTWQAADAGRDRHYTWALAVDPEDPDTWFVSASPSARHAHYADDARACLYRWRGNGPWTVLRGGLPDPLGDMPTALLFAGDRLLAGFRRGAIYASPDRGDTWTSLALRGAALDGLSAMAVPRAWP